MNGSDKGLCGKWFLLFCRVRNRKSPNSMNAVNAFVRCADFFKQRTVFKGIPVDKHLVVLKANRFQADTVAEGAAFNFI